MTQYFHFPGGLVSKESKEILEDLLSYEKKLISIDFYPTSDFILGIGDEENWKLKYTRDATKHTPGLNLEIFYIKNSGIQYNIESKHKNPIFNYNSVIPIKSEHLYYLLKDYIREISRGNAKYNN